MTSARLAMMMFLQYFIWGGVVCNLGHLLRDDPAFLRSRDRAGGRGNRHRRRPLTLPHRYHRGSLGGEREAALDLTSRGRGIPLGGVAADDLRGLLSAPHSLCPMLH